jgi:glycosyltransferase involved in cell wall biosynthesis
LVTDSWPVRQPYSRAGAAVSDAGVRTATTTGEAAFRTRIDRCALTARRFEVGFALVPHRSDRVRVVFLTHNFPRHPGDVSGAFLATLARALMERGHNIQVIAPSDLGQVGDARLDGIGVRRVRYAEPAQETLAYRGTMAEEARTLQGAMKTWSLLGALRRAARDAIAGGADLIHAHWWIPSGLAAPPEAPLVVTVHGTDAALLERSFVARVLARGVFRRARVATAVSAMAGRAVHRATGRAIGPPHQQPMPADTGQYRHWSEGGGGLVVVARLTTQKRVDLALRALPRLGNRDLRLTVVGDGPERARLESLRDQLGLGARVTFLGAVSPAQVAKVLGTADLAVFPARNEGFGLAAAESLMAGVPVVACLDGGGVLDVVPAEGAGRRVLPNPTAIAAAIESLLTQPGNREQARVEGLTWRERLNPAHVAEVCEGWYREALGA